MWRGARPPGPRAALEFDEVFACIVLDNEEQADKDDGGKAPEGDAPMWFPDEVPD